jgi:ADP-ribose pyrophosphatase YjhB (NUDIX family)
MDIVFKDGQSVFNYRVAAVWLHEGHILLHRDAKANDWSLPGGRVAFGEDSIDSLKREMKEELNVVVDVERLLFVNENFFPFQNHQFHEIGFYYLVSLNNNHLFQQGPFYGEEGERLIYQWVPLSTIENITLYPEKFKSLLNKLPDNVEHIVTRQSDFHSSIPRS